LGCLLAYDVGTPWIKAVLVSEDGRVIALAHVRRPAAHPEGVGDRLIEDLREAVAYVREHLEAPQGVGPV
jgi:sugar (pentulose or hexulose) kinase